MKLRTSTSHGEGCEREWSVSAKAFLGENGDVTGIRLVRLDWIQDGDGRWQMHEIPDSEFTVKADLVLFDPVNVIDRATPASPEALSVGIERVWVNGEVVFENGGVTGERPGQIIR